jgi:hypothetical protein
LADLGYRALVLVWFLAYMAAIYLALHIVVARLARSPESRLLWFFSVVTAPITRPVRALLPVGSPESRVRLVTLVVLAGLGLGARALLGALGGVALR